MSAPSAVLTYHSIDSSGSVISVTSDAFRLHLAALEASGVRVVPLSEVLTVPGAVAITFDDGFRNFYQHAFPALCEKRIPATIFIVTGHCGGRNNWASQPAGVVPSRDLMRWPEIEEISRNGVTLGAHTATHPHLTGISVCEAHREMCDSRNMLEDRTGRQVTTFAYPYGSVNADVREIARREFAIACTTEFNYLDDECDPMQVPRLDMYYLRAPWLFRLLQTSPGEAYVRVRRRIRAMRSR